MLQSHPHKGAMTRLLPNSSGNLFFEDHEASNAQRGNNDRVRLVCGRSAVDLCTVTVTGVPGIPSS